MLAKQIEEASLNSWPALQQMLFDGWVVRFAGGYTKRANSVTPVYTSVLQAQEKIAFCERLYQEKHLPAIFRLPSFSSQVQELDELLAQQAYRSFDLTLVLSLPLTPGEGGRDIELKIVSLTEWLPIYSQCSPDKLERQPLHAAILQQIVPQTLFALYCADGLPITCGLGVLENRLFGLFDIVTSASQRRQGYGTRLVEGMLAWARDNGANQAYLQVVSTNENARRLYAKLGFQELYHYWYRVQERLDVHV